MPKYYAWLVTVKNQAGTFMYAFLPQLPFGSHLTAISVRYKFGHVLMGCYCEWGNQRSIW